jgi:hypothetical protein
MPRRKKKLSNAFIDSLIVILVIAGVAWFFWPKIEVALLGPDYEHVIIPNNIISSIDTSLKDKVLSDISSFRQYGQWPIAAVRENPNRGNPFDVKR